MEAIEGSKSINTLLCDVSQPGLRFPTCELKDLESSEASGGGSPALGSSTSHGHGVGGPAPHPRGLCACECFQPPQQLWANPGSLSALSFSALLLVVGGREELLGWAGGRAVEMAHVSLAPSPESSL